MSAPQSICVLGATGSIGVSTLDVVARNPDNYRVVALTARKNLPLLKTQCLEFRPQYAVIDSPDDAEILRKELAEAGVTCEVLNGPSALEFVASLDSVTTVMAAIVGAAGLCPTLAAVKAGAGVLVVAPHAVICGNRKD